MVISVERSADLHTVQLMLLPLTVCCFSKIQVGLPFWYRLTRVVPDKGPLNVCVCVCVDLIFYVWRNRWRKTEMFAFNKLFWKLCLHRHLSQDCVRDQDFLTMNSLIEMPFSWTAGLVNLVSDGTMMDGFVWCQRRRLSLPLHQIWCVLDGCVHCKCMCVSVCLCMPVILYVVFALLILDCNSCLLNLD